MDTVETVVVGAGVVGLAIAERLSRNQDNLVLVERHPSFGRETSSRNSEVVHAGLYYQPGSLKARLCVRGNVMLRETCRRHGIGFWDLGKIVPGILPEEVEEVHHLYQQARDSGAEGLQLISGAQAAEREAELVCREALFSGRSATLDSHALMAHLDSLASDHGVVTAYGCELVALDTRSRPYLAEIRDTNGEITELRAYQVINAAGLYADRVAELAGMDVEGAGYRQLFSKGEYFSVAPRHRGRVRSLVYPAVTPRTLGTLCHGVHLVVAPDGSMKLGPNELYVDEISYNVDPDHRSAFHQEMVRFFPFLEADDLSPDMAGVRPMLQVAGEPFRDFVIQEESHRGLPGFVNLLGIESPGLTSALAIAEHVETLLRKNPT